jgi:tetratricopeptide (TPR) repeat protein
MSMISEPEDTRPQTDIGMVTESVAERELAPNMQLGPYRLRQLLGRGGMGQVWLADQLEPIKRMVALKLQRERVDHSIGKALFEIERQALAQLLHPYIAQIYDAGTTARGELYFAMEYVDGLPLDQFVAKHKLSLRQTVELLVRVCRGVQHAHQRGLIHRDLKPGNVLVMESDGSALPKIIDFGVAVGIDPRAGSVKVVSAIGTQAYMAPEQRTPGPEGIDARVDVYALGVMLLQALLESIGAKLDQKLAMIDGEQLRALLTPSPSTQDHRALPAIPNSGQWLRKLPRELRAIVRKAMSEQRGQRYDSASALAEDLEQWRQKRPVRAMELGRLYAIACFVRRYRALSFAGAVAVVALLAGIAASVYGLKQAQSARALAEARGDRAEQLIGYMLGEFSDKLRELGKLELLDGVSEKTMQYLALEDGGSRSRSNSSGAYFRARAMRTLGEVQSARGDAKAAAKLFAEAEHQLARVREGELDQADLLFERGNIAYWRGLMNYRAGEFEDAERHWLAYQANAQQLVPLTPETGLGEKELALTLTNLGTLEFERKNWSKAEEYFRRAISFGENYLKRNPRDIDSAIAISNRSSWLASVLEAQGDIRAASKSYAQQLELLSELHASNIGNSKLTYHHSLAKYWVSLNLLDLGDLRNAERYLVEAQSELRELVKLEPSNAQWQSIRRSIDSELTWTRFLAGDTGQSWAPLIAELVQNAATDRRAKRALLRNRLREAVASGLPQATDAFMEELASFEMDGSDVDARLYWGASLELAKLRSEIPQIPALDVLCGDELNRSMHFRDVELCTRYRIARSDNKGYNELRARLAELGYSHPDFVRFVTGYEGPPQVQE